MRYFRRFIIDGREIKMAVGTVGLYGEHRIEHAPDDGRPFETDHSVPIVQKVEPTPRVTMTASDLPPADHSTDRAFGLLALAVIVGIVAGLIF